MRAGEGEGAGRAGGGREGCDPVTLPLLHPAQLSGAGICRQQEAQSGFPGSAQAVRKETRDQRVPGVGVFLGRGCITPILFWRLMPLGQGPKGRP